MAKNKGRKGRRAQAAPTGHDAQQPTAGLAGSQQQRSISSGTSLMSTENIANGTKAPDQQISQDTSFTSTCAMPKGEMSMSVPEASGNPVAMGLSGVAAPTSDLNFSRLVGSNMQPQTTAAPSDAGEKCPVASSRIFSFPLTGEENAMAVDQPSDMVPGAGVMPPQGAFSFSDPFISRAQLPKIAHSATSPEKCPQMSTRLFSFPLSGDENTEMSVASSMSTSPIESSASASKAETKPPAYDFTFTEPAPSSGDALKPIKQMIVAYQTPKEAWEARKTPAKPDHKQFSKLYARAEKYAAGPLAWASLPRYTQIAFTRKLAQSITAVEMQCDLAGRRTEEQDFALWEANYFQCLLEARIRKNDYTWPSNFAEKKGFEYTPYTWCEEVAYEMPSVEEVEDKWDDVGLAGVGEVDMVCEDIVLEKKKVDKAKVILPRRLEIVDPTVTTIFSNIGHTTEMKSASVADAGKQLILRPAVDPARYICLKAMAKPMNACQLQRVGLGAVGRALDVGGVPKFAPAAIIDGAQATSLESEKNKEIDEADERGVDIATPAEEPIFAREVEVLHMGNQASDGIESDGDSNKTLPKSSATAKPDEQEGMDKPKTTMSEAILSFISAFKPPKSKDTVANPQPRLKLPTGNDWRRDLSPKSGRMTAIKLDTSKLTIWSRLSAAKKVFEVPSWAGATPAMPNQTEPLFPNARSSGLTDAGGAGYMRGSQFPPVELLSKNKGCLWA